MKLLNEIRQLSLIIKLLHEQKHTLTKFAILKMLKYRKLKLKSLKNNANHANENQFRLMMKH